MVKSSKNKDVIVYQAKSGAIELREDFQGETMWATQSQIVKLFDVDQSVVSRHVKNIFKDKEIGQKSNMQKMHIAKSDKPVTYYSLDVILAVGYRTNSLKAIQFRQWATKTLKEHIIRGYTINKEVAVRNYETFLKAIGEVKRLLSPESMIHEEVLDLVNFFASTWFSLDAYDKSFLPKIGFTKKKVKITADELDKAIQDLKKKLRNSKQASELFAQEKQAGTITGLVGNVFQTFGRKDLYPTLEEKAAHLLYFMVKNHPFTDGNKRSGAFAFVWFLKRTGILDTMKLTPEALTSLTLLVAESKPSEKDRMIGLILMILSSK